MIRSAARLAGHHASRLVSRKTGLCNRLAVFVVLACLPALWAPPSGASVWTRTDAFALFERAEPTLPDSGLSVFVNDGESDPGVVIGESLQYTFESREGVAFLMALVDSKGAVTLLLPPAPSEDGSTLFPPPGTGRLVQQGPVGIETVFAYVTDAPFDPAALGFAPGEDTRALPSDDPAAIERSVATLETVLGASGFDRVRYEYFVDSDVQFGTRAVKRELAMRLEQIDPLDTTATAENPSGAPSRVSAPLAMNDIRFQLDSASLSEQGRTQLDVLGSELLSLMERGEKPTIMLEGHTDDTGPSLYNMDLSERRAAAARTYLVETYGLEALPILTDGHGEEAPLVPNVDDISRASNRRVEIHLAK